MRDAGYTATELGGNFPRDSVTLTRELRARHLELCGAYQWLTLRDHTVLESELTAAAPTFELLRAGGCEHLVIADALTSERVDIAGQVPDDGSKSLGVGGFARVAEGISRAANFARTYGLSVHVHNHVGTYIETPTEVDALLANMSTDVADLCFDTGHYAYGGGDPVAFVRDRAARIGYLHLKDVDGSVLRQARRVGWSFRDALRNHIFSPLGEGMVDVPTIMFDLRRSEYAGWIVVEQDTCPGDATATAARNRRYLDECCGL